MDQITEFLGKSHEFTPFSAGLLVLSFVAAGLIPVPRIILCLLTGAALGLVVIPIAVPSLTVGALIAFLTSRYLAADVVQRLLGRKRLLRSIALAVDQEGWRIVALIRFASPLPGAAANYLFGLTKIDWWSYAWATFVFCTPQVVLFVSLGAAGRVAISEDPATIPGQSMIAVGIVTSALVIFLVARRARATLRALREEERIASAAE